MPIPHLSPLGWEQIALTGDSIWNLNPKVNFENLRSLRKNRIKKKYPLTYNFLFSFVCPNNYPNFHMLSPLFL